MTVVDNKTAADDVPNALSIGSAALQCFWDLASLEEHVREAAAARLVADVEAAQHAQRKAMMQRDSDGSCPTSAAPTTHVGAANRDASALDYCSPLMHYVIQRLVGGLGSGRKSARQGFAVALTHLLSTDSSISDAALFDIMEKGLDMNGRKGRPDRDALMGRVFFYSALVRSGRLRHQEGALKAAAELMAIANTKSFLKELCAVALVELLDVVDGDVLLHVVTHVPDLYNMLKASVQDSSPEALLLSLHLWGRLPPSITSHFPTLPSSTQPPPADYFTKAHQSDAREAAESFFTPAHMRKLLPVFRLTSDSVPRLHSVWPVVLALLIPGFTVKREVVKDADTIPATGGKVMSRGQLSALWDVVVEGDLLTLSHARKYTALQLFSILLSHVAPSLIAVLLSPTLVRCLGTNMKHKDAALQSAAHKAVQRITSLVDRNAQDAGLRVSVAVSLQRNGGALWEMMRSKQTQQQLMQGLDVECVGMYIQQLKGVLSTGAVEGSEDGSVHNERPETGKSAMWAADQLSSAARLPAATPEMRLDVCCYLASAALFDVNDAASKSKVKSPGTIIAGLPLHVRDHCAMRLVGVLHWAHKAGRAGAAKEAHGAQQGEHDVLSAVVGHINTTRNNKGVKPARDMAEDVMEAVEKLLKAQYRALELSQGVSGGSMNKVDARRASSFLHLLRLYYIYCWAHPEGADAQLINDLMAVLSAAFPSSQPAADESDGESAGNDGGEDEPAWNDVLLDVLLSLLSRAVTGLPSAPLREAVENCFKMWCGTLSSTGLSDMLRVIGQRRQGPAEDVLGDEDEGTEEEEEEEEETSDMEHSTDQNGVDSSMKEGAGDVKSQEGVEDSVEDQDLSDMDDEQMFEIDTKLAAYFSALQKGSNNKGAVAALENFKHCVLSLMEIYICAHPRSPLLPSTLPTLLLSLRAAAKPGERKQVYNKLKVVIDKLCKGHADGLAASVSEDEYRELLRRVGAMALRQDDKMVAVTSGLALQYLLKCGMHGGGSYGEAAAEAARNALADFFSNRKNRLTMRFFLDLLQSLPPIALQLLPQVADGCGEGRTDFVKREAFQLLATILKQPKAYGTDLSTTVSPLLGKLSEVIEAAISSTCTKKSRQVDIIKQVCNCVEALKKLYPQRDMRIILPFTASPGTIHDMMSSSLQQHAHKGKLDAVVARLEQLLGCESQQSEQKVVVRQARQTKRGRGAAGDQRMAGQQHQRVAMQDKVADNVNDRSKGKRTAKGLSANKMSAKRRKQGKSKQ